MKTQSEKPAARPSHDIWQVVGDSEDARWTRIGAAWPHKDGKGMNLKIEAIPLVGRIVIRERTEGDGGRQ